MTGKPTMFKHFYGEKPCPKCGSYRAYPREGANDNFCPACNHVWGQAWVWRKIKEED